MHQFSICLDDEIYEGLREMARIERRHYREQAAALVDRDVVDWQRLRESNAQPEQPEQRETVAA